MRTKRRACPRPEKIKHSSRNAAFKHWMSLLSKRGFDQKAEIYRCQCGGWHVGNRRA
jgi:hypothetical protein